MCGQAASHGAAMDICLMACVCIANSLDASISPGPAISLDATSSVGKQTSLGAVFSHDVGSCACVRTYPGVAKRCGCARPQPWYVPDGRNQSGLDYACGEAQLHGTQCQNVSQAARASRGSIARPVTRNPTTNWLCLVGSSNSEPCPPELLV